MCDALWDLSCGLDFIIIAGGQFIVLAGTSSAMMETSLHAKLATRVALE